MDGDNEYVQALERGLETQFNVIAVVEDAQTAVPYRPISLRVPMREAYGGRWLIRVVGLVVTLMGVVALYWYIKGRRLEKRLAEEVREIGGNQSYRRVQDD